MINSFLFCEDTHLGWVEGLDLFFYLKTIFPPNEIMNHFERIFFFCSKEISI